MESSGDTAPLHSSPTPTSPPAMATGTAVVMSPCAACKILRRRCVDRCVLAPYFPPTDPHKFATAHRVFGASNIIKLLQDLPEEQRADAVSSMVYEAAARARDPVYGSAGAICQLQRQVDGLKAQLARAQAELAAARAHHAHLVALLCVEVATAAATPPQDAYCTGVGGSQSQLAAPPGVGSAPTDALYTVDGSAAGGSGIMQAGHVGWADEPLWT
ncbi:LOB domain-containing protein 1-like [Triticum dicoccoides]|uniref:LOB domain-containing protein 1-like n=1 Tax=Triticum dicoccoides TaxID=85692 RepID=UPI00188F74DA|nr:LOB domain-containing protein 1-like [Triticum dicoccoides]